LLILVEARVADTVAVKFPKTELCAGIVMVVVDVLPLTILVRVLPIYEIELVLLASTKTTGSTFSTFLVIGFSTRTGLELLPVAVFDNMRLVMVAVVAIKLFVIKLVPVPLVNAKSTTLELDAPV
jgi:hypothetical protein